MSEDATLRELVIDTNSVVRNMAVSNGVLTEKVEQAVKAMTDHAEEDKAKHDDFEKRIRINERFREDTAKRIAAFAAVVVGVFTLLAGVIKDVATAAVTSIFHLGP